MRDKIVIDFRTRIAHDVVKAEGRKYVIVGDESLKVN